jgi:hypothetical protein
MNLPTLVEFTQFGRVFPLAANSKTPMKRWRWPEHNSDDLEIVAEWLEKYPDANWALIPIRALVVDVDMKNGAKGYESVKAAGGLTPTFTVRTPSGGAHHYYHSTPDEMAFATRNNWLPGVDIRYGPGGYVVLPYSSTANGRYEIEVDLEQLDTSESATLSSLL